MRATKRQERVSAEHSATEEKRSAERKVRTEKRVARGKAADLERKAEQSPEGKKAAKALTEKRGVARQKEQANYKKTRTRASTRMEGRRKQIQAEHHAKPEE